MSGRKWSNEEIRLVKGVYLRSIDLKRKSIAKKAFQVLRNKGFFRTENAIITLISIKRQEWFAEYNNQNQQPKAINETKLSSMEKDLDDYSRMERTMRNQIDYLERYKFKYNFLLLKKIFKENNWDNVYWNKVSVILEALHKQAQKFEKGRK